MSQTLIPNEVDEDIGQVLKQVPWWGDEEAAWFSEFEMPWDPVHCPNR